MFRQKQTPRGNNHPPQKMFRDCEAKTTREHPYGRVIPAESHMQLYWNHTPTPALPRKLAAHSQNTLPEEHRRRAASVLIYNLDVRLCQKKLVKSKNSWDHWYLVIILWLWSLKTFVYIIWQHFLVSEKKINLYSL